MKVKKHMRYDSAIYQAAKANRFDERLGAPGFRGDGGEGGSLWFARQMDYIMSHLFETLYPELTALSNFPVNFSAGEGAATITYQSYGYTGIAKIVSDFSKDFPRADVTDHEDTVHVRNIGASYGYTMEDMRRARFAGLDLEARKASAAGKAVDKAINDLAWAGSAADKLHGIFSPEAGIDQLILPAGAGGGTSWATKTPDEIIADILLMYNATVVNSRGIEHPDTLLLPDWTIGTLSLGRIPNTGISVLQYIRENTPYLKEITEANELDPTAYDTNVFSTPGDQKGTALLYTNSKDKLEIQIPMQTIVYPPQFDAAEVKILLEAKTAGVTVYYPKSALIVPGI